jgi:hypothetical protein
MTFSAHTWPHRCALWLLACSLSACDTPTAVDRHWGLAVKKAQSAQTQPQAPGASAHTASGTDAGIVRASIVRYEKSYVSPPSPITRLDQSLGTSASDNAR